MKRYKWHYLSRRRPLLTAAVITSFLLLIAACEPLATEFDDVEDADYYTAAAVVPVPDTFTVVRVMTWNIRFGAGRLPWFGDACGNRVILTEEEVYSSLQIIADKINAVKPDVLLLQEVDLNSKRSGYINQLRWILNHTYFNYAAYGSQWKAQFIPSDGLGRMDEGNAILSRWKISDAKRIQLALRSDQDKLTRYFYERCCMVTGRIEIPHVNNLYAVNIHASAFATDDTKHKHLVQFRDELGRIGSSGGWFVAGGDLNTLPPGSDTTDYCIQDMCPSESFHGAGDNPMHKEGSNYDPEKHWLDSLYTDYHSAVPTEMYAASQFRYFTHTTRGTHFWDRTLDYLFTNNQWVANSVVTHQDATRASDHAPVSVLFILPK
ncbi:MAG: endonuclease/exonuclease/phosphatase family protein [Bacteroidetes bacterium]|nr:endonuclease/exonuclease/phosphatase family protein [Bacteroidota bacterium]